MNLQRGLTSVLTCLVFILAGSSAWALDRCLYFDGWDERVSVPHDPSLTVSNEFTIEWWVRADNGYPDEKVISKPTSGNAGFIVGIYRNKLYPYVRLADDTSYSFAKGRVDRHEWTHCAVVFKRNAYFAGYVNGVEVHRRTDLTDSPVKPDSEPLEIAHWLFEGRLDTMRIWDTARSADTIADDMHHPLTGGESGLLLCYHFDQTNGATVLDTAPGGNHGTMYGMTDEDWQPSGAPVSLTVTNREDVRGVWDGRMASLGSSIFSVGNARLTSPDYRVFGHQGELAGNTNDCRTDFTWRLDRVWKIEGAGKVIGDLKFDCAALTTLVGDTSRLRVLVDSDDTFVDADVLDGRYEDGVLTVRDIELGNGLFYTVGEAADDERATSLDITNTIIRSVSYDTTTISIGGTNTPEVLGTLWWTNRLNGSAGTLDAVSPWSVSGLPVAVGENRLVVRGTNAAETILADMVMVRRSCGVDVNTHPVRALSASAAVSGGDVADRTASGVTTRGLVWDGHANPSLESYAGMTVEGVGSGSFAGSMTGLVSGARYYVRAFAVNSYGTAYGDAVPFSALGGAGYTLDFHGGDVWITGDRALHAADELTVEFWAYVTDPDSGTKFIAKGGSGGGYLIGTFSQKLYPELFLTDGSMIGFGRGYFELSKWVHLAVVFKRGEFFGGYINGEEVYGTNAVPDYPLGGEIDAITVGHHPFQGHIDELRFWRVARSPEEIRDNMHRLLTGNEPGLIAYYRFDQTNGATVSDLGPYGIDGVLRSMDDDDWVPSDFPCARTIGHVDDLRGLWWTNVYLRAGGILSADGFETTGTHYRVCGYLEERDSDTGTTPVNFDWRMDRLWYVEGVGPAEGDLHFDCLDVTGRIVNAADLRVLQGDDDRFYQADTVAGSYTSNTLSVANYDFPSNACFTVGEWNGTWILSADAGAHGSITPTGEVIVVDGETTNFAIAADTYWHIADVVSNSASVGPVPSLTWSNVSANGSVYATFGPDLAALGTPHWWLAQYRLTNGGWTFDQAELRHADDDQHNCRKEYVANTNPTNGASVFRITALSNGSPLIVCFESSAKRVYALQCCSNLLMEGWTNIPGMGPRPGTDGPDVMQFSPTNPPAFFRLTVDLP